MATIILGVTGSIAAYKAAEIASSLTRQGHDVHCICTRMALEFITPLTLQTLTRNPVFSSFSEEKNHWPPPHIDLASRAGLFVVAPASANTMANMALGLAPDILSSTYLACRSKVLICPAMNGHMWDHPATQHNAGILAGRKGHYLLGPAESGMLACGESGKGRMMPPGEIVARIGELLS